MHKALLIPLAAAVLSSPLHAHFLWLSLRPSESGAAPARRVVSHFSEGRFDRTAPFLNSTLERVQLQAGGESLEWTLAESGASAAVSPSGVVLGTLEYGIFDRVPSQPPALLVYEAKAAWGIDACAQRAGLDVEVCASVSNDGLLITVFDGQKPAAGAEVVVVQDGTFGESTHETDERGKLLLPMPPSPVFAARARVIRPGTGEVEGKAYERVLRYSTICIERVFETDLAPSEAAQLLGEVRVRAGSLPADVRGVRGDASVTVDGERQSVRFEWARGALTQFDAEGLDGDRLDWARETISDALALSAGLHLKAVQQPRITELPSGGYAATLSLGAGTVCRIDQHELRELRWSAGPVRHSMVVGEWIESDAGRILPAAETRASFSESGTLTSCVAIRRTYQALGATELPDRVECTDLSTVESTVRVIDFGTLDFVR